jgi:hypothetical protein
MPIDVDCSCGEAYAIQEAYAGRQVRCDTCGAVIQVPIEATDQEASMGDRFAVQRQYFSMSELFQIWDQDEELILEAVRPRRLLLRLFCRMALSMGSFLFYLGLVFVVVLVVMRDPMGLLYRSEMVVGCYLFILFSSMLFGVTASLLLRLKRHIWFFSWDGEIHFWLYQSRRIPFPSATFLLATPENQVLFAFKRNVFESFFRRTWRCEDSCGRPLCVAVEDSALRSFLRRRIARGFFYHLTRTRLLVVNAHTQSRVGEFRRRIGIRDRYDLLWVPSQENPLDPRIAFAFCVLFAATEGR